MSTKSTEEETEEERKLRIRAGVELSFDPETGGYTLYDEDGMYGLILMPIPAWSHMIRGLERDFSTGSGVILQKAGQAVGSQSAKSLTAHPNQEDKVRRIFSSVSKWGFGRYELVSFDPSKYIRFRLLNNLRMRVEEKDDLHKHHYLIGFYGGYFSRFFRKDVTVEEVSCMNMGDYHCEFEIHTK